MPAAVRRASRLQIGFESTAGTLVAATRRLVAAATVTRSQEQEEWEDLISGTLARTARQPTITRSGFQLVYRAPLSFEEILFPLMTGVKGGLTGVGAGADKLWTALASNTADPDPDTATVEWVESDLTTNFEIESGYCFTTGFNVSATDGGAPAMEVTMVGRKAASSTMTAALAVPAITTVGNARWLVSLDTTWAGLGTTPVVAQVYGFNYTYETGLLPQHYMDNRGDLDFSIHHFREHMVDLTLDCVIDAASTGFVRTQQDEKEAGTTVFVELRLTGPTLGATNYLIKLQGAFVHASDSMSERGGDRDGNLTARMHLKSIIDPTSGNDANFLITNALTAFP